MNRYPLWKYLLVAGVLLVGILYALPNLYGDDYAIQISGVRGAEVDTALSQQVQQTLDEKQIDSLSVRLQSEEERILIRFAQASAQLKGAGVLRDALGDDYVVALNLATTTPDWLLGIGAEPMTLGLDLQGGVYFLMQVDMQAAVEQQLKRVVQDIRNFLREADVRYKSVVREGDQVLVELRDEQSLEQADDVIADNLPELEVETASGMEGYVLAGQITEQYLRDIKQSALQQNLTILRNRVNELGVSEPLIQQQGSDRIVVQLPGVQDTAEAKRILGATATLEYRLVDTQNNAFNVQRSGRVPPGSRLYDGPEGAPVLLNKRIIVTGNQLIDAAAGFDQQSGSPMVTVRLNSAGARRMFNVTSEHVGDPMAVVYIERKPETIMVDGKEVRTTKVIEEVISIATIREPLSNRFQTTGLESIDAAHNLALLLRAGALAAPMEIIQERTVGPSLGEDNIEQGFRAVAIAFLAVVIFMILYYKIFGIIANLALLANMVLLVALLSLLGATLTLPGIAGIVLTLGMAVDANVLIFERMREEQAMGNSPQASIRAGYDKAFSSIADANITTLIAALVLFTFGTGPIKGFAITLSLGIVTSMFTAIVGTRAVVNLLFGGRRLKRLPV